MLKGNMAKMLKQAQEMQKRINAGQEPLETIKRKEIASELKKGKTVEDV